MTPSATNNPYKESEPVPPFASVTLSPYAWHKLLGELEERLNVINRPNPHVTVWLYETISSQLAGHTITVGKPKVEK